jgi:hypothetical protein
MCRYAMVLTRVEEEMDNEITGGWKVVEVSGAVAGRAKCCGASC